MNYDVSTIICLVLGIGSWLVLKSVDKWLPEFGLGWAALVRIVLCGLAFLLIQVIVLRLSIWGIETLSEANRNISLAKIGFAGLPIMCVVVSTKILEKIAGLPTLLWSVELLVFAQVILAATKTWKQSLALALGVPETQPHLEVYGTVFLLLSVLLVGAYQVQGKLAKSS